jgi:tetratricopeptide (TPR) repeat protein
MLDAINEYARQRLAGAPTLRADTHTWVPERHALYYLSLIESAQSARGAPAEREEKQRLEREYHNVRAALRWFLDHAAIEQAARLAGAMGFYWYNWGYWSEGRRWLEQVQAGMAAVPAGTQALVLKWLGVFAMLQGSPRQAIPLLESSLSCYRQAADDDGVAAVLNNLGVVTKEQGDYAAAAGYLSQSLELARRLSQPHKIITTLNNLGTIAEDQEQYPQALELYQRSLEAAEAAGSSADIALSRLNLGRMLSQLGRLDAARPYLEAALGAYQELENQHFSASAMQALGEILLEQGERAGALQQIDGALQLISQTREQSYLPSILESWARISAESGSPERAAFLLFAAERLRQELELATTAAAARRAMALRAELEAGLSEAVFQSSRHAGQAATVDSVLEYIAAHVAGQAAR